MSEERFIKFKVTGSLPMALPLWTEKDWCHPECYARWSQLEAEEQALLGGHVHYNGTAWRVPESGCPPMLHEA